MIIKLIRDDELHSFHNFGQLFIDDQYFGETLEDTDRFLEAHPNAKISADTAIPRGRYRVILSESKRFGRIMPEVLDVRGFTGVRIHGGNTESDTAGCPLLGAVRTKTGVANCGAINERLIDRIERALAKKEDVWLVVT